MRQLKTACHGHKQHHGSTITSVSKNKYHNLSDKSSSSLLLKFIFPSASLFLSDKTMTAGCACINFCLHLLITAPASSSYWHFLFLNKINVC